MEQTDVLQHFGILGMKWGRRRSRAELERARSDDSKSAKKVKSKSVSEMSNDELKSLTQRMQLERQLRDLRQSEKTTGQRIVEDVLKEVGKELIKSAVKSGIDTALKKK